MDSNETNYNKIPEKDTISFSPIVFQPDKIDYEIYFFHNNIKGNASISFKPNYIEIKYEFEGVCYIDTIDCNISFCNHKTHTDAEIVPNDQ